MKRPGPANSRHRTLLGGFYPGPTHAAHPAPPAVAVECHRNVQVSFVRSIVVTREKDGAQMGAFFLSIVTWPYILPTVTAETFKQEIADAMKAYDKYVICIDKTPDEFHSSLVSLLNKAIKAYENRGPQLRHGIALDRQVTVILSQNDSPRPLCGIYFNLHSPYQKTAPAKAFKPVSESIGGNSED
jgi:hypothetical protein